jgi:hypothetical protein
MTSERKDLREKVVYERTLLSRKDNLELLRHLDAADPLRAVLREVVEALEGCRDALQEEVDEYIHRASVAASGGSIRLRSDDYLSAAGDLREALTGADTALAKLREIHPTTGGTDDG